MFYYLNCLSADLTYHVSAATETSVSYIVLFTDSYKITEDISKYKNILLITSSFRITAYSLLNNLLNNNIINNGYIYNSLVYNKVLFKKYKRFYLYQSILNYKSIILLEISGDQIKRLLNIREERDWMLGEDYYQGVYLSELEYQLNNS
ncbi:hypothetical protein BO71DRAFT_418877 [Aspergillus ellipticus CBS 707.79]|uniref:Uncharacterized protein n=1 Tax=Aspergillus ellipticus CBS 707.79 TaxID=1448320 RepID=A0A319DD15_9EURO|nr:hypothetical protein BO71DRAFT_418877 [Aspergillus ellipticus CBS 707.79]